MRKSQIHGYDGHGDALGGRTVIHQNPHARPQQKGVVPQDRLVPHYIVGNWENICSVILDHCPRLAGGELDRTKDERIVRHVHRVLQRSTVALFIF